MTGERGNRLTLDRPAAYQIKVPGVIDLSQADRVGNMTVSAERDDDKTPVTTLTG
jgi:hypothetical protein